jgi:hypothetical protein
MNKHKKRSVIERIAESLRIIPKLDRSGKGMEPRLAEPGQLTKFPPPENGTTGLNMKPRPGQMSRKSIIPLCRLPVLTASLPVV